MKSKKKKAETFWGAYYGFMVGATVVAADGDSDFPSFTLEKDGRRYEIEVSRDPEGNGPGFLAGLPTPKKVEGGFEGV